MNLNQLEYREKVHNIALNRQRKLLESYYLLKAKSFNSLQFEENVKRFMHVGVISSASKQALSILFSDIDPELYDLPDDMVVMRLHNIYQELFASSGYRANTFVPRINTTRSSLPKQNAPRTPSAFSNMHLIIDEEDSEQAASEYSL